MLLESRLQTEIRNISGHVPETLILRLDRIIASVDKFIRAGGHDQRMEAIIEVIEGILVPIDFFVRIPFLENIIEFIQSGDGKICAVMGQDIRLIHHADFKDHINVV